LFSEGLNCEQVCAETTYTYVYSQVQLTRERYQKFNLVHFTIENLESFIDGRTESGIYISCRPLGSKDRPLEGVTDDDNERAELGRLIRAYEELAVNDENKHKHKKNLKDFYAKLGFEVGNTVPGRLLEVNKEGLKVTVSLRPSIVKRPPKKDFGEHFRAPLRDVSDRCVSFLFLHTKPRTRLSVNFPCVRCFRDRFRVIEKFKSRPISNPLYMNISLEECNERLKDKEVGTVIFRPCGHSKDCLSLSWRCSKEVSVSQKK